MNVSEVKIKEKSIIINNIGIYRDESIFNSGPIEKANNKKTTTKKVEYERIFFVLKNKIFISRENNFNKSFILKFAPFIE